MKRNLSLFFLNIILSLVIAYPLGYFIIGKFIFKYRFFDFVMPGGLIDFTDGFLFGFILLSPVLYILWGHSNKVLAALISIIPIVLLDLYIGVGKAIWFWSLIFFATGIIIASVINFFLKKQTTSLN